MYSNISNPLRTGRFYQNQNPVLRSKNEEPVSQNLKEIFLKFINIARRMYKSINHCTGMNEDAIIGQTKFIRRA